MPLTPNFIGVVSNESKLVAVFDCEIIRPVMAELLNNLTEVLVPLLKIFKSLPVTVVFIPTFPTLSITNLSAVLFVQNRSELVMLS